MEDELIAFLAQCNSLHFARWRCWKQYGTGVAGDLMVHLTRRAQAFGGIYRFADGRNMPDVHTVLFEYNHLPVYCRLTPISHHLRANATDSIL
jgi:hypothetical protein